MNLVYYNNKKTDKFEAVNMENIRRIYSKSYSEDGDKFVKIYFDEIEVCNFGIEEINNGFYRIVRDTCEINRLVNSDFIKYSFIGKNDIDIEFKLNVKIHGCEVIKEYFEENKFSKDELFDIFEEYCILGFSEGIKKMKLITEASIIGYIFYIIIIIYYDGSKE